MGSKEGKVWGETTEFFRCQTVSAHYLDIKKGGYSSYHRHEFKANIFYIVCGSLLIEKQVGKHSDKTVLTEGQSMVIAPGIWHTFSALVDTKCIEVYQVILVDPDIERKTVGGMVKAK